MRTSLLLKRSLAYYWRTNLAVIFGVAVAVAVLAGALLVGDSVRASLRDLFLERLGRADHIISAASFFREQLADEMRAHEQFAQNGFTAACPLIVLDATVTHQDTGRRAGHVQVYGVDERFWKFHEQPETHAPRNREALLSESLGQELLVKPGDALLLRVEKPSAIPAESLHGRKEDLGRTIRLSARERLPASALGDFSVRPQQAAVRAVFVPLALLQKELEQEGKANAMLISEKSSASVDESAAAAREAALLERILKDKIKLEDLGIKLRLLEEARSISLESDSALLSEALAATARRTADESGMRAAPVLSYLANSIRSGQREIPYSLVTALDEESLKSLTDRRAGGPEQRVSATPSSGDAASSSQSLAPIILNDWAARELNVQPGAEVSLDYYLWQEDGRLLTRTAQFQLAGIAPIEGIAADRNLVPEYPGITGTESLADWDPPFPVELERVRPQDEAYWKQYRTTPKAFVPLSKGEQLWQSRFGKLTSMRLIPSSQTQLQQAFDAYGERLRGALDPSQMGFAVYPARAQGLEASRGATDFGEYFLYFSFFLVVSALLLTALFFKLGIEQRLREIGVLQAIGFPAAKIRALFLYEGILLAVAGSVLGLAGALVYGKLMMTGLSTWWVGAVGTTRLTLRVSPVSMLMGGAGGVLIALCCVVWTLKRLAPASTRSMLTGERGRAKGRTEVARARSSFRLSRFAFPLSLLLGLALLTAAALGWVAQVAGFFGGGTLLLVALLCWQSAWLRRDARKLIGGNGWWAVSRLGFRNATHRPGRSVLCIALIASASFIIVAVDAFRRADSNDAALDRKSGSGGFPLLAESLLPLVHDPNTQEGREALNFVSAEDATALRGVNFTRFRVRPGDDASCLNLYQPRNPRILAPVNEFIQSGRFTFQDSMASTAEEKGNPWLLLNREATADGAIPVIADANSMTYVLHLKLGDDFLLNRSGGAGPIRLRLVGALSDSIFQGEFLMSEKNFLSLFPEQEGYRFFLLDTATPEQSTALAGLLEERLSDFGFDVAATEERLANFHRVENTFISTFQMLGGLGLVLGTLGLSAVLLRNVLERRRELALLRAVGYDTTAFAVMAVAENAFILFCGLLTGAACALLAIAPVLFSRGGRPPTFSLGVLLLAVLISGLLASLVATVAALRSPLLPALRSE
ncbi:MAG: ABC transporter permease [Pyrinomonadaceae bacterium]